MFDFYEKSIPDIGIINLSLDCDIIWVINMCNYTTMFTRSGVDVKRIISIYM